MSDVFADTHYFLALLSPTDEAHQRALDATARRTGRLITTEWVLAELGNSLHRPPDRSLYSQTLRALRSDPEVQIVPADHDLFEAGTAYFEQRPDKEWSLTDCISFVVMERLSLSEALTADHHFEQAGFRALLA